MAFPDYRRFVHPKPGNLDLDRRPIAELPGGEWGTVRSISIQDGDRTVLIPTVVGAYGRPGRVLSDEEAVDRYYRTGENLGSFPIGERADTYGERLSASQARKYGPRMEQIRSIRRLRDELNADSAAKGIPTPQWQQGEAAAGKSPSSWSNVIGDYASAMPASERKAARELGATHAEYSFRPEKYPSARYKYHTDKPGEEHARYESRRLEEEKASAAGREEKAREGKRAFRSDYDPKRRHAGLVAASVNPETREQAEARLSGPAWLDPEGRSAFGLR